MSTSSSIEPDLCRLLLRGKGRRAQAGYHGDADGGDGLCNFRSLGGGARRVLSRDLKEAPNFQPVLLTPVSTCLLLRGDAWGHREGGTRLRSHCRKLAEGGLKP